MIKIGISLTNVFCIPQFFNPSSHQYLVLFFYKMLVPIQSEELKPNFLVGIEAAQVKESESGIKILTKCVQTERAQFPGGSWACAKASQAKLTPCCQSQQGIFKRLILRSVLPHLLILNTGVVQLKNLPIHKIYKTNKFLQVLTVLQILHLILSDFSKSLVVLILFALVEVVAQSETMFYGAGIRRELWQSVPWKDWEIAKNNLNHFDPYKDTLQKR